MEPNQNAERESSISEVVDLEDPAEKSSGEDQESKNDIDRTRPLDELLR